MRRLGDAPKGRSPLLSLRVSELTLSAIKHAAKKNGNTVSAQAREWLEASGKDYIRAEAARPTKGGK